MKQKYCAFLRGVNVNGVNIKMDRLKQAFIEMGFEDVKTVLATGNVVFCPGRDQKETELGAFIERELSRYFQYEAHVLLRDALELQTILDTASSIELSKDYHLYCLLIEGAQIPGELEALFDSVPHLTGERFIPLGSDALWIVPKGSTLLSGFGSKVLGRKRYKSALTSRNINTIIKILGIMRA